MARTGRPRLTEDALAARIDDYCRRYGVAPTARGLPPFPSGRRETRQHREWLAVYKAHRRLARRSRGTCERCGSPAVEGSVFCEEHRTGSSRAPVGRRRALLEAQGGRCPICGRALRLAEATLDGRRGPGAEGALLHPRCLRLADMAREAGAEGLERLRAYLGPQEPSRGRAGR